MSIFVRRAADSVVSWGEQRLIAEIRRWLGDATPRAPFGIGDDCAVVPSSGQPMLITTDPVIYGHHFDDSVPARAVGAKLLKRNLSDIAAMGGHPVAAVVSLALSAHTSQRWLREFHRGIAAAARKFNVKIVGGDVTQAPANFFGAFLTLHGEAAAGRVVTRTGGRRGDHLYVTGVLGGSLLGHHHRFTPRLAEGTWLARRPEVRAMMDVSDGLAKDLHALTGEGVAAALDETTIPISTAAHRSAKRSKRTPLAHALSDGEDYELLVVVRRTVDAAKFEAAWRRRFPRVRLTRIGALVGAKELPPAAVRLPDYHGYEHLR